MILLKWSFFRLPALSLVSNIVTEIYFLLIFIFHFQPLAIWI